MPNTVAKEALGFLRPSKRQLSLRQIMFAKRNETRRSEVSERLNREA